jgi:hypothetical protein
LILLKSKLKLLLFISLTWVAFCPEIKNSTESCKRLDRHLCYKDEECPSDRLCCTTRCGGSRCLRNCLNKKIFFYYFEMNLNLLFNLFLAASSEPENSNVCFLSVDAGPDAVVCDKQIQNRWFFDSNTNECKTFTYNGWIYILNY